LKTSTSRWNIDADNITKRYPNGHLALDGINLQVACGEVLGLLGQNGAGKTTLLKILCGLLQPSQGRLTMLGIDGRSKAHEIKRYLGVVSQDINLDQPLTVRKNLERHCSYFPFRTAKPSGASTNGWLCSNLNKPRSKRSTNYPAATSAR